MKMATVLQQSSSSARGIICLTHKEAAFLERGTFGWASPWGLSKKLMFRYLVGIFTGWFARRVLEKVRKNYFIGVHVGSSLPKDHPAFDPERWDFILCSNKLWRGTSSDNRIPLVSAHFIPERLSSNIPEHKDWDLTYIATDAWFKNWPTFVKVSKELISSNDSLRVLAVSTHSTDADRRRFSRWFLEALGPLIGQNVKHIPVVTDGSSKGLDQEIVSALLRLTEVFVLFSKSEGSSKVTAEALMSGCSVFVYKEYVENCFDLPPVDEHHQLEDSSETAILQKQFEGEAFPSTPASLHFDHIAQFCGLEHNVAVLSMKLSKILGIPVEIPPDDLLRFKLPAHTSVGMPWFRAGKRQGTSDLGTAKAWASFGRFLKQNH